MFAPVTLDVNLYRKSRVYFDFTRCDTRARQERRFYFRKNCYLRLASLPARQEALQTQSDVNGCDDEARGNSALAEIDVIY